MTSIEELHSTRLRGAPKFPGTFGRGGERCFPRWQDAPAALHLWAAADGVFGRAPPRVGPGSRRPGKPASATAGPACKNTSAGRCAGPRATRAGRPSMNWWPTWRATPTGQTAGTDSPAANRSAVDSSRGARASDRQANEANGAGGRPQRRPHGRTVRPHRLRPVGRLLARRLTPPESAGAPQSGKCVATRCVQSYSGEW